MQNSTPQGWEYRWVAWVARRRVWVLAAIAALSVVAGYFAAQVQVESSIEIWFLDDDPDLVSYKNFLERFGADELTVMGVFVAPEADGDLFTPERLARLDAMAAAAATAPYAHGVRSLADVKLARSTAEGVAIEPLYERPPTTITAAAAVRRRALSNDLVVGNLLAPDGRAAAILLELDPAGNSFDGKVALMERLREIAAQHGGDELEVAFAGSPHLDEAFVKYSERDYAMFGPVMFFLVLAVTWLLFRRWSAALIPIGVVALANLWLFGVMGALGIDITLVTSAMTALILAVGVADSIHVLSDYYQHLMRGVDREEAVIAGTGHVLVPCLFTSLTTAAGFLSLLVSQLAPIREFGWLAALGVVFAFVLSVTWIPAVLHWARPPRPGYLTRRRRGVIARVLGWMGRPTWIRSAVIVAMALGILAVSIVGVGRLEVGANVMNYFKADDPVVTSTLRIDRALGGSTSVEVLIETEPGGLKDPEVLQRIERLAETARDLEGVAAVLSITDLLTQFDAAVRGVTHGTLPDSRALAAQYYLMMGGEGDLHEMVSPDYDAARLTVRVNISEAKALVQRIDQLEAELAELSDDRASFHLTGYIKLMENMETYLVDSQVRSFLIAFFVVSLLMFVLLRSWRLGLFAMIPNLLPIAMGLGLMGWVGIALDAGTVMIAGIALGLVVDDTVHFMFRLRSLIRQGVGLDEAIERAMEESGRPITITSLILAAGFSVLIFGSFTPNIYFGLVSACIVLFAVIADLVVLPSLLYLIRPNFRR